MRRGGHHAADREEKMNPRGLTLVVLLFCLLLPAGMRAQEAAWRLGHEPRVYNLNNGLTIILQKDASAAISVVQLLVRGGDRDDPPGMPGLAYLTARLSLEIPDSSKLRQLMDFGSSVSFSVGGDFTLITIRSLSRNLDQTLAIIASILSQPLFSDLRVDRAKERMRHLQKKKMDNPSEFMRMILARTFFDRPAYGAERFGNEASLAAIGKKDIQAFSRGHYVAGNMIAVLVSDLDEDRIEPLIARRLEVLPSGQPLPHRPVGARRPQVPRLAVTRQLAQTHISLSALLPGLTVENFLLASLLETWLGKGIGSRLWFLRSRQDLAYGIHAELQPNREAMLLSVYLQTDSNRSAEAQAKLAQLMKVVYDDGISEAELAATKAYARADFWRENETREDRAATLAFMEGMGLSHRLAGVFWERLQKIGLAEFNRFIRAWLAPERWFSLQIGPAAG
jgi:zinc protease